MLSFFSALTVSCPVPARETGIAWNPNANKILVEMYGDPLCPVCAEAWPGVSKMIQKYNKDVKFVLHLLPLPYHTWAFVVTRTAMALKAMSPDKAQLWMHYIYTGGQDQFYGTFTEEEATKLALDTAAQKCQVDRNELQNQFNLIVNNLGARVEFKYSTSHGIDGTPYFFVNGVQCDNVDAGSSIDDWSAYLDTLLN